MRRGSEYTANQALAARVRAQATLTRDILWRAAWLRATFGMGFDQSIQRAQQEAAERASKE